MKDGSCTRWSRSSMIILKVKQKQLKVIVTLISKTVLDLSFLHLKSILFKCTTRNHEQKISSDEESPEKLGWERGGARTGSLNVT